MEAMVFRCFFLVISASVYCAEIITLNVKSKSGFDGRYELRDRYGTGSWGIKGDGAKATVWEGNIWFNGFPGESGKYEITSYVILEADGQPPYKYTAGGRTLKEGVYPYAGGSYKCNTDNFDAKGTIDLGVHQINKGDKINVWGKSVYKCQHSGSHHGAYARWYQLVFKPTGTTAPFRAPVGGAYRFSAGKKYALNGVQMTDHRHSPNSGLRTFLRQE